MIPNRNFTYNNTIRPHIDPTSNYRNSPATASLSDGCVMTQNNMIANHRIRMYDTSHAMPYLEVLPNQSIFTNIDSQYPIEYQPIEHPNWK